MRSDGAAFAGAARALLTSNARMPATCFRLPAKTGSHVQITAIEAVGRIVGKCCDPGRIERERHGVRVDIEQIVDANREPESLLQLVPCLEVGDRSTAGLGIKCRGCAGIV